MQPLLCIIPIILDFSRYRTLVGLFAGKSPHFIRRAHSSATRRNFAFNASKPTTAPSGFAITIEGQNRRSSSFGLLVGKMVGQTSSAEAVIDGHRRLAAKAPSSVQVITLEVQNNTAITVAGTHQIGVTPAIARTATRRIEVGTKGRKLAFVAIIPTAIVAPPQSLQILASSCSNTIVVRYFQTARNSR